MEKRDKGFTLLELIVVITLLSILFSIIGFTFIKNIEGTLQVSESINRNITKLSVYTQLNKQIFSIYKPKNTDKLILLKEDRLSFYTGYPVFFEGFVRAEYIIKEDENGKKIIIYEEFPYIDNRLGYKGLKKLFLGKFNNVSVEFIKDKKIFKSYVGDKLPDVIKLRLDDNIFYIEVK